MDRRQKGPVLAVLAARQEMDGIHPFRQTIGGDLDDREQIEAQKEQVHQVFVADILAGQMGVDEAQAAQPAAGGPDTAERRNDDLGMAADDDIFDLAGTMDQQADLPIQLKRQLAQSPRPFPG